MPGDRREPSAPSAFHVKRYLPMQKRAKMLPSTSSVSTGADEAGQGRDGGPQILGHEFESAVRRREHRRQRRLRPPRAPAGGAAA